jgi:heme A synthase
MFDTPTPPRPVPRWLHVWAVVCVVATAALLILGGLVTTFRVGMADPVWPTEPWYLFFISWQEPSAGFLIEHTHRLAGFTVGGVVAVLAVGAWLTEPRKWLRWFGVAALAVLLAEFGQFHRELMKQVHAPVIAWPTGTIMGLSVDLIAVAAAGLLTLIGRTRGAGVRAAVLVALVAVMVQGLLGGFRVRLNELLGTDLAAVHGCFAQVVFAWLVCVAVATAKPRPCDPVPAAESRRLKALAVLLAALAFVQLIWGAIVRHNPDPLSQRLHLLTAFAVVGVAVWLAVKVFGSAAARQRLGRSAGVLIALLIVQVSLGVEAWLGKFGTGVLPELQKVDAYQAVARSSHTFVGTCVLATAAVLAMLAAGLTAGTVRMTAERRAGSAAEELVSAGETA